MTGTSIDGIDAALLKITGRGLAMTASLVRHVSQPLGDLQAPLRAAAAQQRISAGELARLAWDLGCLHARTIKALAEPQPDLICIHGQTIFHQPPLSCQLVNPAPIARAFTCPVVFELRQADLAAGGQGAPITPIADWILFRDPRKSRAIINLGGFCNVTILPADRDDAGSGRAAHRLGEIRGFDACPCNHVLDSVARIALKRPFDADGAAALAGIADPDAVNTLAAWMRRRRDAPPGARPTSLGTGDEAAEWVQHHSPRLKANDLAASAANAIGACIAAAVAPLKVDEAVLAGGGAHNKALVQAIATILPAPLRSSAELGVPVEAREAACFAVLGALCADGVPITLPQVTGCAEPAPLSGAWINPRGG